jgi:hypothetical protein
MHAFQGKSVFFRQWRRLHVDRVAQREQEEYQREQQEMLVKEHTAELHRKRALKRAVVRGLRKNKREE